MSSQNVTIVRATDVRKAIGYLTGSKFPSDKSQRVVESLPNSKKVSVKGIEEWQAEAIDFIEWIERNYEKEMCNMGLWGKSIEEIYNTTASWAEEHGIY